MIALTARLNERDETIIGLQEELDAMDRAYKEQEEFSERRLRRIARLEKALKDNQLPLPLGDEDDQQPFFDADEINMGDSPAQLLLTNNNNQDTNTAVPQRRYPAEDDP